MKPVLSATEIEDVLKVHPEWRLEKDKLVREWIFRDFIAAMAFVNRIAAMAEAAGHHPDIDIRYNRILLGLVSHDAGGITGRDVAMITRIRSEFPAR